MKYHAAVPPIVKIANSLKKPSQKLDKRCVTVICTEKRSPAKRADFTDERAAYSGIKAIRPKKGLPKGINSF
jgi:hypothetical protein